MAAEVLLHNTALPTDVNGDGRVSSADALAVINFMARVSHPEGESFLASGVQSGTPPATPKAADLAVVALLSEAEAAESSGAESSVADRTYSKMVDVDNNGMVTAGDALIVINRLQAEGEIPADTPRPMPLDYSMFPKAVDVNADGDASLDVNVLSNFKTFDPDNPDFEYSSVFNDAFRKGGAANQLSTVEVNTLLDRASAATRSNDAIIAVVDRSGRILGVRVEEGVSAELKNDPKSLAFAIDGAVAKARTAAFFSSNAAPITSRTIRSLSQSTMVQRVVESSPVATDQAYKGPGFVAPIGVGGKFPPEIDFTPQVDLFAIEHQSRDSQRHPGPDGIKGNTDDFYLRTRFNADPTHIPSNSEQFFQTWPESYGVQTDTFYDSESRGIATLPGGVPLYKGVTVDGQPVTSPLSDSFNLVGGLGVFFPGEDGYATHEQGFKHASETPTGQAQSEVARTNASKVLEAEFAAFMAAAGNGLVNPFQPAFVRDLSGFNKHLPALKNFFLPTGRIDLVGITLEIYGPNPTRDFRQPGVDRLIQVGQQNFGGEGFVSGSLYPINKEGELLQAGQPVPEGWLVAPHDSKVSGLTAEAVDQIIAQGVLEAQQTRAAIRLDIDGGFRPGARTSMVLSVADTNGDLLGAYRMPDATIFSIDVSIAKARNTAYYADGDDLQPQDRIDFNNDGEFGKVSRELYDRSGDTLNPGTALTNRTFRFLVEPRYPTGIELHPSAGQDLVNDPDIKLCDQKPGQCLLVGPQSILRLPGINPITGENIENDSPLDASIYGSAANTFSVLGFDAFNPSRNFRDPGDQEVIIYGDGTKQPLANQNGIVFFPGSTPLYLENDPGALVGGFGVSGDGVDQDDVVTVAGQSGYAPPASIRVDQFTVAGVRLPFQKFNRNPLGA